MKVKFEPRLDGGEGSSHGEQCQKNNRWDGGCLITGELVGHREDFVFTGMKWGAIEEFGVEERCNPTYIFKFF